VADAVDNDLRRNGHGGMKPPQWPPSVKRRRRCYNNIVGL
jgi:hypothetical protein